MDRPHPVVEAARAAVIEAQADEAVRLEGRQDVVADLAVHRRAHVLGGAEHEGQRRHRGFRHDAVERRSEEHTSELQSLMRISYAVFCLKKKKTKHKLPRK